MSEAMSEANMMAAATIVMLAILVFLHVETQVFLHVVKFLIRAAMVILAGTWMYFWVWAPRPHSFYIWAAMVMLAELIVCPIVCSLSRLVWSLMCRQVSFGFLICSPLL
jgi:polyferredoxin